MIHQKGGGRCANEATSRAARDRAYTPQLAVLIATLFGLCCALAILAPDSPMSDTTGYGVRTTDYSQICAYRDLLWYNEARTD